MSADEAWFYSTLAQSTAAIVGLIGALLGSQIIARVEEARGSHDFHRGTLQRLKEDLQLIQTRVQECKAFCEETIRQNEELLRMTLPRLTCLPDRPGPDVCPMAPTKVAGYSRNIWNRRGSGFPPS